MDSLLSTSCENQQLFCDTLFTNNDSDIESEGEGTERFVDVPQTFVVDPFTNEEFQCTNEQCEWKFVSTVKRKFVQGGGHSLVKNVERVKEEDFFVNACRVIFAYKECLIYM